jgi:hypothetical protein
VARRALHEVMKPQVIMRLQLPVMAVFFTGRVRELAASTTEVFWYEQMRRLALTVAARSALGLLLTVEQLGGEVFEDFVAGRVCAGVCAAARCNALSSGILQARTARVMLRRAVCCPRFVICTRYQ